MSSEIAIEARGLGKVYAIFNRPEDRLKQMLMRGRRKYYREFWALRDLDLDVYRGETVGIVGRNGSGKSTLLQLICGTLSPTCGELTVNGRVAALLELGAGFNPEFTGRDNVFMNAAILGLEREDTEQRFDAIAAFADIGQFIDQPVKTYSSGMYARLAFAVAINVDPDILVVDEALSVGDEAFQRKCFARINEIRERGATILFVSHAASNIIELCDRAVLMDRGERLLTGKPKTVIAKYQKLVYAPPDKLAEVREELRQLDGMAEIDENTSATDSAIGRPQVTFTTSADRYDPNLVPKSTLYYLCRGAEIRNVRILDDNGNRINILSPQRVYRYAYEVYFSGTAFRVHFGMFLKSITGIDLGGMGSHFVGEGIEVVQPGQLISVVFRFHNHLLPGTYFTNAGCVGLLNGEETFLHRILDAVMFRVEVGSSSRAVSGYINISEEPSCTISFLGDDNAAEAKITL